MSENQPPKSDTVFCAKLKKELPGIVYRPFEDELGARIKREISAEAWQGWLEHSKMLVNEYRLDLTSEKAHNLLKEQCEEFLFGDAEQSKPPEFVPES